MKLAATVIYVDDVPSVLDFYRQASALEPSFVDQHVRLLGCSAGGLYQFAGIGAGGGALQFGTHDLGRLLMPGYSRPVTGQPSGIEIVFCTPDVDDSYRRAVDAGAEPVAEPRAMPWGQRLAYVRSVEGTFVGICTPPSP